MNKVFDADKIWAYLIAGAFGFFEPLSVLMLWFLIFVLCDMITGIAASVKERTIITSSRLQRTIQKLLMYMMCIILVHGIDMYMITIVNMGLARICATIICGIELYSILENCYRVTGNEVFKVLTQFTLKKIEDKTGVQVSLQGKDGDPRGKPEDDVFCMHEDKIEEILKQVQNDGKENMMV